MYNLQIYIDADYKKTRLFTPAPLLYACRYSFAMSTHVCNVLSIDFVKSPGLSVVSDPRNVLRHKQERLTMWKLEFLVRSMYNDGASQKLCFATFYVQIKPHFLN